MGPPLIERLARYGWVLVLIATASACVGIFVHFSRAKAQLVQREVNHRSELLAYEIKEIIGQQLDATRSLATHVYSELRVHQGVTEVGEAQALLQAYAALYEGVLVQAAIYSPDNSPPIHYIAPDMPGLPAPPTATAVLPSINPDQLLISVLSPYFPQLTPVKLL